jgi:ubiquinone/menaquinone biosynthesis C-methylase UbiE
MQFGQFYLLVVFLGQAGFERGLQGAPTRRPLPLPRVQPRDQPCLSRPLRLLLLSSERRCCERLTKPSLKLHFNVRCGFSLQAIPPLGKVLAGDWESYQYLVESIRKFPAQEDFRQMITHAGFRAARYENLTGGIAAIHSAVKL